MMLKAKVVCSFSSACLLLLILGVSPALGQKELKEANELHQKMEKLYLAGRYAEAIPLAQRVLELREKALGPAHPDVALSLNNLAVLYDSTAQPVKAEPLYQRSLAIREKALGPAHPDVALSLNNLAVLYEATGQYAKAKPLMQRSLAIREKALGPEHPDVALSLNSLAVLYEATGQYAKAEPLMQRSLAIREKALGPEHPDVATSLNSLAGLYKTTGQYAKAEPLYQRSLAIRKKALGPVHPDVASSLNNLATLYNSIGQYAKAELLMRSVLAIDEKSLGHTHPDVATSLDNLALLYKSAGQYAKAEPLMQRSLAIREKALGPEHPDVATSLNSLAGLYQATGQYAKAEPLYQRSLAIYKKALGQEHRDVALTLNNLAALYDATGQHVKAEPLYQRSLAIYKKALGQEHRDVALTLNNLAALYDATGQHVKAEPLYQRSLAIYEKVLGLAHPGVAAILGNLADLYAAQRNYGTANRLFTRSLNIQDRQIREVFAFTTEDQKLQFLEDVQWSYWGYLSMIHQHLKNDPQAVHDGFETVLRRKGVVFDAEARTREALRGRLSKAAHQEWGRLSELRSELAQMFLNKPQSLSTDQYQNKLATLQQQIEQSEQRLATESTLVNKELQQRSVTIDAVAKHLPTNAALVEFVKIRDRDFANGQWESSWRYLAFVLTANGNVALVDLGDASTLEGQIQGALHDIKVSIEARGLQLLKKPDSANPSQPNLQSLKTLYSQVWTPLEKALGTAEKVTISPDGLLNLVPFAALIDREEHAVVERYRLTYVSSGRELVASEGAVAKPESNLLLVANPAFDGTAQGVSRTEASLRSRDFRGVFSQLPGTEREAKEIPPLVTDRGGKRSVLVESKAIEGSVKSARSPRILHLATHGFFLQDEEIDLCAETRGVTVMKTATLAEKVLCEKARGVIVVKNAKPVPPKRYENPLIRSGLAFAGANKASEVTEGDDGILTALEITGMDLYGTELVVLSACDTGVGEVKTGEGVFGLRRAFALAGAKNLMMSLWPVSDEITANQMKAFYRNLQKLPPAEALRQAQLETIKELKAQYDGMAPPGLWAPFILQGAQALGQ
jgi:CHAT domain-containing protein